MAQGILRYEGLYTTSSPYCNMARYSMIDTACKPGMVLRAASIFEDK